MGRRRQREANLDQRPGMSFFIETPLIASQATGRGVEPGSVGTIDGGVPELVTQTEKIIVRLPTGFGVYGSGD